MIKQFAAIVVTALATVGVAQAAGNAEVGKVKSAMCEGCHGQKGEGVAPNPKLTGIPEADFVKALKDYKSGAKSVPMMNAMAAALTDQEMEDLAAYYALLK
jgi:cytochrome c553